ncbi:MAG: RNA methyltransferase, partial [Clostridia bacterium]|nr:RNA methyltransferase [Clostridia bacterium]
MISLPEKFKENMRHLLDEDCYEKFLSSFNDEAKRGVVINTKIASSDLTCRFLPKLIKIPFAKSGYAIKSKEKFGNTWVHHAGLIYMQEPSSMAAGNLVENKENLKILDLCASPGGKTINAYLACGKNSVIVSNEINKERAKILFQNIERLG